MNCRLRSRSHCRMSLDGCVQAIARILGATTTHKSFTKLQAKTSETTGARVNSRGALLAEFLVRQAALPGSICTIYLFFAGVGSLDAACLLSHEVRNVAVCRVGVLGRPPRHRRGNSKPGIWRWLRRPSHRML